MLFNSMHFAIFFPIVAIVYFLLPYRMRTAHLLVSSCVFYMAFIPAYILILALTIFIDYIAAIYLVRTAGRARSYLLWLSVASTCLVLFFFKYFYFVINNIIVLAGLCGWQLSGPTIEIVLPIGLSFHTFQSLSYVIEVYRGRQKAETSLPIYATYVMFFPQLVAGPIERPQNLLHQFYEKHDFDHERVTSGLKRMAWGFFKKLVIADRLALYVNDVYAAPQNFNGLQLTIATVFFAYQIYCDFSGYSDIAIGSARVLGFRFAENFDRPYHSLSVAEFWRRWHISLSTWFRDYVYFPMGGNRVRPIRHRMNQLVTFGISGLWHGANWTYVCWGVLNGFYLIAGDLTRDVRNHVFERIGLPAYTLPRRLLMLISTFVLTCAGWILFRAQTLADAWYIVTHLASNWDFRHIATEQFLLRHMPVAVGGIVVLEFVQAMQGRISINDVFSRLHLIPRWTAYATIVIGVFMLGTYHEAQFIYFQF